MSQVPAFCNHCDLIFPSGFNLVNVKGMTFTGIGVQCPRCGNAGRILDGAYDAIGETIQGLLKLSLDELQSLLRTLEGIRRANDEEAERSIDRLSHHGMLSSLAYLIPKSPERRIAVLTLLCLIINTLINSYHYCPVKRSWTNCKFM